jgi:hypothetical protein
MKNKQMMPALKFGPQVLDVQSNTRIFIRTSGSIVVNKLVKVDDEIQSETLAVKLAGDDTYFYTALRDTTLSLECDPTTEWSFWVEKGKFYKKLSDKKVEVPLELQTVQREAQLRVMLEELVREKFGDDDYDELEEALNFDINDDDKIGGTAVFLEEDAEMELRAELLAAQSASTENDETETEDAMDSVPDSEVETDTK